MNDRIKLAKLIGRTIDVYGSSTNPMKEADPNFDPFTDANDCEALIKHLNGLGIIVKIEHYSSGVADCVLFEKLLVDKGRRKRTTYVGEYEGDNWKRGVCELALKIIDNGN